jgi:outer membrane biosynthesis protein TonB
MEVRQLIRQGVTLSAIAHGLALALLIVFSEVHRFGTVTAEPIAVDLVRPGEIEKKPEPAPQPAPTPQIPPLDFSQLTKPETTKPDIAKQPDMAKPDMAKPDMAKPDAPPPAAPQAVDPRPQPQTARPNRQEAALRPQPRPQPSPLPPPAPSPPAALGYTPAEPDVTVKYHVMLGLPESLPPPVPSSGKRPSDDFDATASTPADISSSLVTEFRRHLKTCSKLPASVAPSDNLVVKLRVLMRPDGRLAADPLVGGGSANPKALDLLRSAIDALKACQPYAMLPADRYGEWKVLDLDFTPLDFAS